MIVDFDRAARTGGARHPRLGLPERRPALLGAAHALRAGGCRAEGRWRCCKGAMEALGVGDPWLISTDVGPVIDDEAADGHRAPIARRWRRKGRLIAKLDAPAGGRFVAPHIFRVSRHRASWSARSSARCCMSRRFEADELDAGRRRHQRAGLRPDLRPAHAASTSASSTSCDGVHAGNIYVNRNQIGAVVGSQPFGGEGLSGTGPKAGGPHYLRRFRKSATTCRRYGGAPRPRHRRSGARRQPARLRRWRLVGAGRPHRRAAQTSARQGRRRPSRPRPPSISGRSTCRVRPARPTRWRWRRAAGFCASARMAKRFWRR